jgi:hypothetical protein
MSLFRLATVALASTLAIGSASAFELTVSGFAYGSDATIPTALGAYTIAPFALGEREIGFSGLVNTTSTAGRAAPKYTYQAELGGDSFVQGHTYTNSYSLIETGSAGGFNAVQADLLGKLYTVADSGTQKVDTKKESVAFQLAVFEIIYDNPAGQINSSLPGAGNFRALAPFAAAEAAEVTLADQWVAAAKAATVSSFTVQKLVSVTHDVVHTTEVNDHTVTTTTTVPGTTDFLYVTAGAPLVVPEPSALLLMASGICAIGFVGRRRLRERA